VLAWEKIPILTIVHACNNQTFETKQHLNIFQATTTTYKHYKRETKLKTNIYQENIKKTYLPLPGQTLAKQNNYPKDEHHSSSNGPIKLEEK